jgi:23S rRNA pseudouridine1911/1915/1917 synthase
MHSDDVLEWCPLEEHSSIESLLKTCFKASGQQIKKYGLNKNWLARKALARDVIKLPLSFVNRQEVYPVCEDTRVQVVGEGQDILALHKPFGVHTHPLNYTATRNLVSWLAAHGYAALTRVNAAGMDRGCLWRLDGETSGLVLYAKNDETYRDVRENFATHFRKKYYLAIVHGDAPGMRDVRHHLSASGVDGHKMKVSVGGQPALLHYEALAHKDGKTLVLVELVTGVRHQIRIQLASLGHPIVGDELYGGAKAQRMYLHCWRYESEGQVWTDNEAELFNDFFDLHSLLQVITNKLR